jgi:predicted metalloprotease
MALVMAATSTVGVKTRVDAAFLPTSPQYSANSAAHAQWPLLASGGASSEPGLRETERGTQRATPLLHTATADRPTPACRAAVSPQYEGVDIEGRRRSEKFEDRGRGSGGVGGGLPIGMLSSIVSRLGIKGTLVLAAVAGVGYLVLPASFRQAILGLLGAPQGSGAPGSQSGSGSVCQSSPDNGKACDFLKAILASTEDVWTAKFAAGGLPRYGVAPGAYEKPTGVVFSDSVATGGCGSATSAVGPFYCPGDKKLYIDPTFYDVMEKKLKAPGDFAQAYVIAHEVGHHVQNLIGVSQLTLRGETKNQASVRLELQADCFAGVWGHTARASLAITDDDLKEAVNAAHAIGDDTLGHSKASDYTHGTSAQRMRWFRRGFDEGDARQCDTFAVTKYTEL